MIVKSNTVGAKNKAKNVFFGSISSNVALLRIEFIGSITDGHKMTLNTGLGNFRSFCPALA